MDKLERLLDENQARTVRTKGKHPIIELKNGRRMPLPSLRRIKDPRTVLNLINELQKLAALPVTNVRPK